VSVNQRLAITIPTYNRADFLDYSLEVHIPIMQVHNIPIYISDNASTDNTQLIVEKWQQVYPYIYYHRNDENLGPDKNFEIALRRPKEDFVWLLGDTYYISFRVVSHVLEIVINNKNSDAIVLNLESRLDIDDKVYTDHCLLLSELGGLMSCMSCLVYSKNIIRVSDFSRYYFSHFLQTGVLLEMLAKKEFSLYWLGSYSVLSINNKNLKKTNWSFTKSAIDVGVNDWLNFIFSLPVVYNLDSKNKAVKSFGIVSGLLTYKGILIRRPNNVFSTVVVLKNIKNIFFSAGFSKIAFMLFLNFFPAIFFVYLFNLRCLLNKKI